MNRLSHRIATLQKQAARNSASLSPAFVLEDGEPVSASMPVYGLGVIARTEQETLGAFEQRVYLQIDRAISEGHIALSQLSTETLERCLAAKNAELKEQYGIEFILSPQYEWVAVQGPDFSIHREPGESECEFLARVDAQFEEHKL